MDLSDRYRQMLRHSGHHRRHLFALVVLALVTAPLTALQPLSLKLFIDNALGGRPVTGLPGRLLDQFGLSTGPRSLVAIAAVTSVTAAVAAIAMSNAMSLYTEWVGSRMVRDVSVKVFDHLQRLSPIYHFRNASGEALSAVTSDSSAVYTAVYAGLVGPVSIVLTLALVAASAWRMNSSLTIIALATAAPMAVASRMLHGRLHDQARRSRRERVAVLSFVSDVVQSLPLVQAFTAESQNLQTFRTISQRSMDASRRTAALDSSAESAAAVVGAVGTALMVVIGGRSVVSGQVTVGELVVFIAYFRTIDRQFQGLLAVGRRLRMAQVGLDRIDEIATSNDRIRDPLNPVALARSPEGCSITWDDVTFGYDTARPVLRGVTLHVEAGETVAIVGRTGAGKSTLVALASRLFDPDAGRVLINGVDIGQARVTDVRSLVATVRQDPLILPLSVAENIALARPGASADEIRTAADRALATEFIEELPDGFDTVLAENGANLSGGQRQRLALARAFLKDAPILILDEPTAALDPEAEHLLVESMGRISKGRTVLVIAHRLSTIRRADRAVVLDDGVVIESGTHDDLVRLDGQYARFHRVHATGSLR